jgi:hypothetical protein
MMPVRVCALVAAVALLATPGAASPQSLSVEQLLSRATAYVEELAEQFSTVVAEEDYQQDYVETPVGRSQDPVALLPIRTRRRLLSDLLLSKPPGSPDWHMVRDVFEVDGKAVRVRSDRLTVPFAASRDTAAALEEAKVAVAGRSGRFDLPNAGVYHPMLALSLLQPAYQQRLQFALDRQDRSLGPDIWVVRFQETARPTIVRGPGGTDVAATGRLWIQAGTGRVVRTEFQIVSLGSQSVVLTTFARDERLGVHVPTEMRHTSGSLEAPNQVTGTARYGRFRRIEGPPAPRIETRTRPAAPAGGPAAGGHKERATTEDETVVGRV